MIKDRRGGPAESMTTPESFDAFYTKKLEALKVELKDIIKDAIVFVVGREYACPSCQARLKWHRDGRMGCFLCNMPRWSQPVRIAAQSILERYPNLEECREEWEASRSKRAMPQLAIRSKKGDEALGKQIKEARQLKGWSLEDLAAQITTMRGKPLSRSGLQHYEDGWEYPSEYVLGQLKDILGLEV